MNDRFDLPPLDASDVIKALGWEEYEWTEGNMDAIALMFNRKVEPLVKRIQELEEIVRRMALPRREKFRGIPCSREDCTRDQYSKGLCSMHYNRWRRQVQRDLEQKSITDSESIAA